MPVPKLCDVIRKINFLKAVEQDDQDSVLEEHYYIWKEECKLGDIRQGFLAYEERVAVKKFPDAHTPAHHLADSVLQFLLRLLEGVVDDENPAQLKEAGNIKLHTWKAMLEAGPGISHLYLMEDVFRRDKEFLKAMSPNEMQVVFSMYRRDFVYCDIDDLEEYCRKLRHALEDILDEFTEEQYVAARTEALDLYIYYISRILHMKTEVAEVVKRLCRSLSRRFDDENIYLGLQSVDVFKKHLGTLKEVMFHDQFHEKGSYTEEAVGKAFEDIMKAICIDKDGYKLLCQMFEYLMALLEDFSLHGKCKVSKKIFDAYRSYLFKKRELVPTSAMFDVCIRSLIEVSKVKSIQDLHERLIKNAQDIFLLKQEKLSPQQEKQWLQFMIAMVKSGRSYLNGLVRSVLNHDPYKKAKYFKWKNNIEEARQIIDIIGTMKKSDFQDDKDVSLDRVIGGYKDTAKLIVESVRKERILAEITPSVVKCILNCLKIDPPTKTEISEALANYDILVLKKNTGDVPDILRTVREVLKDEDYPWDFDASRTVSDVVQACVRAFDNGRQVSQECNKCFLDVFLACFAGDDEDRWFMEDNPDVPSVYFVTIQCGLLEYAQLHSNTKTTHVLIPLLPEILKWANSETEVIRDVMIGTLQWISVATPKEMAKDLPAVLDIYINLDMFNDLYSMVSTLYPHNPEAVHARLQEMFDKLPVVMDSSRQTIVTMFHHVSQKHPEVFTEEQIGILLQLYQTEGPSLQPLILITLRSISEKCPENLVPFMSVLLDDSIFPVESFNLRSGIIACVGHIHETQAAVDYLVSHADETDPTISLIIIGTLRSMVKTHGSHFEKHKEKLQQVEKTTSNPSIAESCHDMILVIEGKHVEDLFEDLKEQQEDIDKLDTKVGAAKEDIDMLAGQVIGQGEEISGVQKGLVKVGERVDDVEQDLGETKIKVEEVDKKTMSNAPVWSRDITKLLNPEAPNDWRLLASRLGYSNNDIRAWATQHDPCMALLSEWYATHKTSEASHGVLMALQEMNRQDAAVIMENAMKAAEDVVEDEEFEYPSPPPIFISYQWGVQNEVRLLHKHLNMAGYECWMDIGQMGGGDKLFAKIDNGIRAAKLVICCVTEKYAQSPNCNKEVNLSVNLGKPIIPLLMEKMSWPPKGSMGPIFSEYLFVRFFQRAGEETKDQRYWPVPKFQEVLMQLNYHKVMPNEVLITKEYKNWWAPEEEEIIINKSKKNQSNSAASAQTQQKSDGSEEVSPEVFLSYQWGKQPQIKALYHRLTGMGYSCWMDIHQMGGGDSLYDKIDRGMRGCKVVVSCVTPKYSLSANCRREVSLADTLKKPIIPLLLEKMTWPPDGPMSMVFTELLFINFYRDPDNQMKWQGDKFEDLTAKMNQNLQIESGKPEGKEPENKPLEKRTNPAPKGNETEKKVAEQEMAQQLQKSQDENKQTEAKAQVVAPGAQKSEPENTEKTVLQSKSKPSADTTAENQRNSGQRSSASTDKKSKSCLIL